MMRQSPPTLPPAPRTSVALLMAVIAALLACNSQNKEHCVAAIQYNGVRYTSAGTGDSKASATQSAQTGSCMAYCDYGDATLERAYQAWKSTPKGAATKTDRGFNIHLYLKEEKATCERHCNAARMSGTAQSKVECR